MWVCSHATWKLAFLMMDVKASHIGSWDTIFSPPWAQQRKRIPMGPKGWPQMQCDKSKANRGGRPNLFCIAKKKTFEAKCKKKMTRRPNNQVPIHGLTQDLKCAQCKSKGKSKMMLKKEWLCNISKMFSWSWSTPLSTSFSKGVCTMLPP
jgi:hypothetical protein